MTRRRCFDGASGAVHFDGAMREDSQYGAPSVIEPVGLALPELAGRMAAFGSRVLGIHVSP